MKNLFTVLAAISIMGCITPAEDEKTETAVKSKTAEILSGTENEEEKLEAIFYFVRDEIEFNWIYPQDISVEEVINNSYGVCMQKANLFSAIAPGSRF